MSKRKRQEAILSLIGKHQIATQEELVDRLGRVGINTTQATVSRDIGELGLVRVGGPESHYVKPNDGLGAASPAGREDRLRRLLRDLPLTVRRGQGIAVLTTTPGSASPLASGRSRATTRSSSRSPFTPAPTAGSPSGWRSSAPTSSRRTSTP